MNWKALLQTLQHIGIGAASAGLGSVMPQIPALVNLIPNPVLGAVVGSAVSSLYSLYSNTPGQMIPPKSGA